MKPHLLFVYHANGGLFSVVSDFAHKILSPSTYPCQLCALTYGNFAMKQAWKSFIGGLSAKTVFLHKNEFEKQYHIHTSLPAVFIISKEGVKEIITQQQIAGCQSLEELKNLVNTVLKQHVQYHHSDI